MIQPLPSRLVEPLIYPLGWRRVRSTVTEGISWASADGLFVIVQAIRADDGKKWKHLSVSRQDRLPSWDDLRCVKDLFLGRASCAYQVLPPADEYVNIHPNVLHLWECMDGRVTPDFRTEGGI